MLHPSYQRSPEEPPHVASSNMWLATRLLAAAWCQADCDYAPQPLTLSACPTVVTNLPKLLAPILPFRVSVGVGASKLNTDHLFINLGFILLVRDMLDTGDVVDFRVFMLAAGAPDMRGTIGVKQYFILDGSMLKPNPICSIVSIYRSVNGTKKWPTLTPHRF